MDFSWLTSENALNVYKYTVFAGFGVGAVSGFSRGISRLGEESEVRDALDRNGNRVQDGLNILCDTLVGGADVGLLVATAPVSVPYYLYTRK